MLLQPLPHDLPPFIFSLLLISLCLLVAQTVKNPPAMQEFQARSLGWEDPLEKRIATHSSTPYLENPRDRGVYCTTVHGVTKNWTQLSD